MKMLYEAGIKVFKCGSKKKIFAFECPMCSGKVLTDKVAGERAKMCKACDFKNRGGHKNPAYTHGGTNSRLYRTYNNIKNRCYYEKGDHYARYGGRGIKMCDEWLNSFEAFSAWALANGYNDTLTIDRINVNGDYTPENCQWLSYKENSLKDRVKYTKENIKKIIDFSKNNNVLLSRACVNFGFTYVGFKQARKRYKNAEVKNDN